MNRLEVIAENPLIDRLASGLVHSLWEGLLIAVALALLLPSLRGRPSARYAAGWLALVLMACSVPLTAWLAPAPSCSRTIAPVPVSTPERTTFVAGDVPRPDRGETTRQAMPSSLRPTAPAVLPPVADIPAADRIPPERGRSPLTFDLGKIVRPAAPWTVGAWLIGVVLLSLWRLGGWLYLHRLCHRGATLAAEDVQAILDRLHARLGVRRAVRLLESARVHVPAVIGWLRPVVLLPLGLLAGMTPQQVELILAHELAHIRRQDFLANLIQTAIETCLFYHPAVWWISRMIRMEREACCDDLVVATTGERLLYARALARLAELCIESRGARLRRLPVAADGGDLLSRVRRIVGLPGTEPRWTSARLAGGITALAMVAVLTGYVAVAVEPPTPAPQDKPKPGAIAPRAESTAPRTGGERPRVVEVRPADGATEVEPYTEIRIRFDRPMSPTKAVLEWDARGQAGYRLRGPMRYDSDRHEFTLPVRLTPGRRHDVTLNRDSAAREGEYDGFRAADGPAAAPFRWSFTTARPKSTAGGPAPRVVSVSPASETEVALLTPVEVTFDRPMDPASYRVSASEQPGFLRSPALADRAAYDPGAKRFTLILQLPPNWNGELRLEGFRGADGADAQPIPLKYRTLREPLAPALRRRVEGASESARLRTLIERIRAARRKLSSVSETVVTTSTLGSRLPDWRDQYSSEGATFKMHGDRKFVAVVDEIMGSPFRVISDGTTCWFMGWDRPVALPARAIDEKKLLFADPFDARGEVDVERIIRDRKLDDRGDVDFNGRRCHLIQSWDVLLPLDSPMILGPRWYIDAATLLPVRVERGETYALDFTYSRINEPIPDDEFRPVAGAEVRADEPGTLPAGCTGRFLNVIDGSSGRMTVRWGETGPKGSSGGLN